MSGPPPHQPPHGLLGDAHEDRGLRLQRGARRSGEVTGTFTLYGFPEERHDHERGDLERGGRQQRRGRLRRHMERRPVSVEEAEPM